MKLSLDWLRQYMDTRLEAEELGEVLTELGLEVEGMEEVQSVPGGLKGLVIGEVLQVTPHENADKLKVTEVSVGQPETYQIVCGAPNVAVGQKVVVALPGTTIYPTEGDPFVIKKAKIRGVESWGMICAADEIGLGKDHSGIMVLEQAALPGMSAAKYFQLESDVVYEIGLTPNRSDANSHLGVARDLSAYLSFNGIAEGKVQIPLAELGDMSEKSPISLEIMDPMACPRYMGCVIEDVVVKESPEWLKKRLISIGLRPKNAVVDITNFILHEMGQPLHAFDLDTLKGGGIVVRSLTPGTEFETLDGQKVVLGAEDLMICDAEENPLCMAGVYGGKSSGVTEHTQRIFLESAHFNPKVIRRSSMRHNLRTDAAKAYEKGTDPNVCDYALRRAVHLILTLCGGRLSSPLMDFYPNPIDQVKIPVNLDRINALLGIHLSKEDFLRLFESLHFSIAEENQNVLTLEIPTYKTDVTREADVAEEVLRIYGINKVTLPEFMKIPNLSPNLSEELGMQNRVANLLKGMGLLEAMSLSFAQSSHVAALGFPEEDTLVHVNNTSNTHLDILRPNLLFSSLENISRNQNRQQKGAAFFEFGNQYAKQGEQYQETPMLALVLWGRKTADHWKFKGEQKFDFFDLKALVQNVLAYCGIQQWKESPLDSPAYAMGQRWGLGQREWVSLGAIHPRFLHHFDIKDKVWVAEFHWANLLSALKRSRLTVQEPSKYPMVSRDFALLIAEEVSYGEIEKIVLNAGKPFAKNCALFDVYRDEKNLGIGRKSYAINVQFSDATKTLEEGEIEKTTQKIVAELGKQLGAEIRN
jgi:phenylalanyl-tRNA synthetase beta chain